MPLDLEQRMDAKLPSLKLFIFMMTIIENDFRGVDLNLLLVFRALMQERNVTRAAQRLFLGQPAVSGALKRLRQVFGDELFVRTPEGMMPTPRALDLSQNIEPLLLTLHEAMKRQPRFDPRQAQRVFHIGLSDALELVFMPALVERLRQEAPGIRVISHSANAQQAPALLDAGEIELAIGVHQHCNAWHRLQPLLEWKFVCIYNPRLVKLRRKTISLEEFLCHPHVLTSFNGTLRGFIDEQLEKLGKERQVVFSSPGFATSPFIVQRSPALACVPAYIADVWCDALGLAKSALPFSVPEYTVSLLWPMAADREPGLRWLIGVLAAPLRIPPSRSKVE